MLKPDPSNFEQLRVELEAATDNTWTLQPSDDSLLLICSKNHSIKAWFPMETTLETLLRSISLSGRAFNQGVFVGAELRQKEVLKSLELAVLEINSLFKSDLQYDDPTYFYN
jgi:hypothetical protein